VYLEAPYRLLHTQNGLREASVLPHARKAGLETGAAGSVAGAWGNLFI